MALTDLRLSILAFPQRWDGAKIHARVLLLPTGDPLKTANGLPKFAGTTWKLRALVLPGLDAFWAAGAANSASAIHAPATLAPPANAVSLFDALRDSFPIVPTPVPATPAYAAAQSARLSRLAGTRIKKELPESYTSAFPFDRPDTDDALLGNEFGCAVRSVDGGKESDPKPPNELSWGQVIAFALRQPLLARALGLLYDFDVPIADAASVKDGSWLFLTLDPAAPAQPVPATPDTIKSYAARIPLLAPSAPRGLFAAVLFPLGQTAQAGYDTALHEAAIYDDGFAKILHSFQPHTADAATSGHNELRPATDTGVDIGWDDEQIVIWHNRQIENARARLGDASLGQHVEAPLGVAGYRIDVRTPELADTAWHSLCEAFSADSHGNAANIVFPTPPAPAIFSKSFKGELTIEPAPVRNRHASDKAVWLPRYFARWQDGSLVVPDETHLKLTAGNAVDANGDPIKPQPSVYAASAPALKLRYGVQYEFRCRFADQTGGGPATNDKPANLAPAPITTRRFLRHVPPKAPRIETQPPRPDLGAAPAFRKITQISVWRPQMGYPEFIFAGLDDPQIIKDLIARSAQAKKDGRSIGANDPDVESAHISVQVRAPVHDPGPAGKRDGEFRDVYAVQRAFPAFDAAHPLDPGPALTLNLAYEDVPDIEKFADTLAVTPSAAGDSLSIPRARDVRIRITPLCDNKANYYANDAVRRGITVDLTMRAGAKNEDDLFVANTLEKQLNAIFLQPASNFAALLAQQLDLDVSGLRFAPKKEAGQRVVFGASGALRHTLPADNGAITFATESELRNHWVVALMLELNRDWTWDGLEDRSFEISRVDHAGDTPRVIGQIDLRFAVNQLALAGSDEEFPDRRETTRLIFFDAVNPHPPQGKFPEILEPSWTVTPRLKGVDGKPLARTLQARLPVAAAPHQTPHLASAGIAFSPFQRDEAYSETKPRRRALWLEFTEPIADKNDTLFARVLSYGPDPLLSGDISHILAPTPELLSNPISPIEFAKGSLPNPPPPPELAIDPEPIRVIVPNQAEDFSGLDAMVEMTKSVSSDRHYLLPLPPGVAEDAPELFGFWTYEIRVGHKDIWSTAQARFGRPLRVTGVQHPAPALLCTAYRVNPAPGISPAADGIVVTAPHATAVFADRKLTHAAAGDPRTRIWVLLYGQVVQADGRAHRNILLQRAFARPQFDREDENGPRSDTRDIIGLAVFPRREVEQILADLAVPLDSPLSVIAVEVLPGGGMSLRKQKVIDAVTLYSNADLDTSDSDPLRADLGTERSHRILRTSPLTPVPPAC
jgi:hypothetical protein